MTTPVKTAPPAIATAPRRQPWAFVATREKEFRGAATANLGSGEIEEFYCSHTGCEITIVYSREEYITFLELFTEGTPAAASTRFVRHKKRGTLYEIVGEAECQGSTQAIAEGETAIVYRGEGGKLWVRNKTEFNDGRFEPIILDGQG